MNIFDTVWCLIWTFSSSAIFLQQAEDSTEVVQRGVWSVSVCISLSTACWTGQWGGCIWGRQQDAGDPHGQVWPGGTPQLPEKRCPLREYKTHARITYSAWFSQRIGDVQVTGVFRTTYSGALCFLCEVQDQCCSVLTLSWCNPVRLTGF